MVLTTTYDSYDLSSRQGVRHQLHLLMLNHPLFISSICDSIFSTRGTAPDLSNYKLMDNHMLHIIMAHGYMIYNLQSNGQG